MLKIEFLVMEVFKPSNISLRSPLFRGDACEDNAVTICTHILQLQKQIVLLTNKCIEYERIHLMSLVDGHFKREMLRIPPELVNLIKGYL